MKASDFLPNTATQSVYSFARGDREEVGEGRRGSVANWVELGYLLLHLSFKLAIEHDFLLVAHLRIEQFHSHVLALDLEPPNELLLRPAQSNRHTRYNNTEVEQVKGCTYDLILLPTSLISKYCGTKLILILFN